MIPKAALGMTRVLLLLTAFAVFVTLGAAQGARAQSSAVDFAQKLGDDAITKLTDPQISDSERVKRMRELLDSSFDPAAVSRFVLGPYVRRTSEEQFQEFMRLYKVYVAHNYAGLFKRYSGERVEMQSARKLGDGDQVVSGVIRQPNGPPIGLELRLRPTNGSFNVVDLRVEGVSMPLTHRKQFASVISQRGGKVEGLLNALRDAVKRFERDTPS